MSIFISFKLSKNLNNTYTRNSSYMYVNANKNKIVCDKILKYKSVQNHAIFLSRLTATIYIDFFNWTITVNYITTTKVDWTTTDFFIFISYAKYL